MAIKRVFVVLLATVSLASAVPAYAQSERGNITGVVADPSRAGIPGVSVKVINTGTNATTQRRVVGVRNLQRRQPAARHVSHRGRRSRASSPPTSRGSG